MYEEQRRRRDEERETKERAAEEEAERLAAEKQAREDEEAAKWLGQISLEQQGEEAQSEEQAQVCIVNASSVPNMQSMCCMSSTFKRMLAKWKSDPDGRVYSCIWVCILLHAG